MTPDVQTALDAWLGTWADGEGLPVAWENIPFTPPDDAPWLKANFLPAEPYSVDLAGDCVVYPGVYQVTVMFPAARGRSAAFELARDVAHQFPDGLEIEGEGFVAWVTKPPAIAVARAMASSWGVPVSVSWRVNIAS